MYQQIRAFFQQQGHLEVDTPLLSLSTNTDINIQSVTARVSGMSAFLQTSPEFAMKRLLVEGSGSIYQICHAFRDEEQGRYHHPEFTLLEWYSLGLDYTRLMDQLELLIQTLVDGDLCIPRLRYFDCFRDMLKLDLATCNDNDCRQCVTRHVPGIDADSLGRNECLDLLVSEVISKRFEGFTFVYDYPAAQASLARIKTDNALVAERFELFFDDLELANGFSELTDADEQRARFEHDNVQRQQRGLDQYTIDEDLLAALEQGLPECAGVALGLDRLLMVIQQVSALQQVLTLNTL